MERSLIEMTATDVTPHIFPMLMRQRAAKFCALAQNRVFQHNRRKADTLSLDENR
jgi:hypothetical protein